MNSNQTCTHDHGTACADGRPQLSAEQVRQYRQEGYLILNEPILPKEEFQALKDHFEQKLAKLPSDVRPESMDCPHFTDPVLFRWLFSDVVLDLIEPIIGPDICLFASHFICKPKGNGKRVPWHEDSAYWKGRMSPYEVVTVWLAIDPSLPENGCMNVIPKTHGNGFSDYEKVDPSKNVFDVEIKRNQYDSSKAVPCILQPNEASLHDGRIIHGSAANTSNIRRCGYTMRYTSTAVKHIESDVHVSYLARGKDLAGNTYGDPTKVYTELARYRELKGGNGH